MTKTLIIPGRDSAPAPQWQADLVDRGCSGWIKVASGYGPWPGGQRLRNEVRAQSFPYPTLCPIAEIPMERSA
jgi:predicted alpha/beta hydrolase family esterase